MTHKNSQKHDLTAGPIDKHLVRMAIPMIWGILAVIGFQLVDMYFVSLLGTEKLAAITFTFPVTYFVFALTMGLGISTSSVISRQIGQGQKRRGRRLATHALMMAAGLGLFFMVIGLWQKDPLFRMMGAAEDMLPLIGDYMSIWLWGAAFVTVPIVGNAVLRAGGDAMIPAKIMMLATIINLIFDPLLIFGLAGFPRMELQGAALATVLANVVAAGVGLYILKFKKDMICRSSWHIKLFSDSAKKLMVIAIPAGLTQALQPIANSVIIALLAAHGTAAVAAFGITSRIEAFAMVIVMALSVAMGPILGQNHGAGQHGRVHETLHKSFKLIAAWSLLTALALVVFAKPVAGLFSDEPEVIAIAALFFWIVPLSAVLGSMVHGWASAFNALGTPKRSFMLIFVKMIVLLVPLSLLGSHFWGIPGIFGAIALTNVIAGGLLHPLNWRAVKRLEQDS